MPVVKRLVEPIHCSRIPIPKDTKNDLEAVAVNTLSSVILQLSSLAKHAEGIFSELFQEASTIHLRTVNAQQRIEHLSLKVQKLDSAGEEISLQEINMKKAFKLTVHSDQQVISRQTMPLAMMESYSKCDPVPNLAALTQYRHDGRDALKFYTDPSYFFELWKNKMSAEFEKRRRRKKKDQRGKKRDVEKKVVNKVKKKDVSKAIPDWEIQGAKAQGNAVISTSPAHDTSEGNLSLANSNGSIDSSHSKNNLSPTRRQSTTKRASNATSIGRPSSAPPPPPPGGSPARQPTGPAPPPPPPLPGQMGNSPQHKPMSPPPPPPSMLETPQEYNYPPPYQPDQQLPAPPPPTNIAAPPPPPPPPGPPPLPGAGPPPPPIVSAQPHSSGAVTGNLLQSVALKAAQPLEPVVDERNDLLNAIKQGMNLRKTQQITREEKKQSGMGNDVASILARRIAVEFSDSEEDDSDFSDDDWSDD